MIEDAKRSFCSTFGAKAISRQETRVRKKIENKDAMKKKRFGLGM
jgi:hypothetical protein